MSDRNQKLVCERSEYFRSAYSLLLQFGAPYEETSNLCLDKVFERVDKVSSIFKLLPQRKLSLIYRTANNFELWARNFRQECRNWMLHVQRNILVITNFWIFFRKLGKKFSAGLWKLNFSCPEERYGREKILEIFFEIIIFSDFEQ